MYRSMYRYAHTYNIPFKLSVKMIKHLYNSDCLYCCKSTNSSKKTYQNTGLHNWKNGYIDNNVFPLCKFCYIIRNGCNKKTFLENVCNIIFRKPVKQKMIYDKSICCRKYGKVQLCKVEKCAYCFSKKNLSFNKIDSDKKYTKNNVQTLCWTCNRMKSNLKEKDFFNHLYRVFLINYSSLKLSISNGCPVSESKKDSS